MSEEQSVMDLRTALEHYLRHYASDGHAAACLRFLAEAKNPFHRETTAGHFTGSAWLVDRNGERVLLTHHRKLQRWLQLGGHADGNADLASVALREAREESGLAGLSVEPAIFDVDRHWIPERKHEPGHWHYDVRYIVRAESQQDFVVSEESLALAWVSISSLAEGRDTDASLRRMAQKWLMRGS